MSVRPGILQPVHATVFLDAVFGVIIALALTDLPAIARRALAQQPGTVVAVVLMLSALVFTALYWAETRQFVMQQERFTASLADRVDSEDVAELSPSVVGFVLGTLAMAAVAATILYCAREGLFRAYMVTNGLFWLLDLSGTGLLRRSYSRLQQDLAADELERVNADPWFLGHIRSRYFIGYGAINALVPTVVLLADLVLEDQPCWRLGAAGGFLVFTLFRHLAMRSSLLDWWVRRALEA